MTDEQRAIDRTITGDYCVVCRQVIDDNLYDIHALPVRLSFATHRGECSDKFIEAEREIAYGGATSQLAYCIARIITEEQRQTSPDTGCWEDGSDYR